MSFIKVTPSSSEDTIQAAKPRAARKPAVTCSCAVCGKEFKRKVSQVVKCDSPTCSPDCRRVIASRKTIETFRSRRIQKPCVICGKINFVKKSHADTEGTYCSKDCMAIGYKTRLTGIENPNYRHGRAHIEGQYSESRKRYVAENPEKIRMQNRRTRVRRKGVAGGEVKHNTDVMYRKQSGKCNACKCSLHRNGFHLDHIIPLAKGGTNFEGNVQLLCNNATSERKL